MKKFLAGLVMAAVVGLAVAPAMAASGAFKALPTEARASIGATHFVEFTPADFAASTATNTALCITNAIPAKWAVSFVAMVLETAFDTKNTGFTGSCAMKVGDASDDDLFLTSTELASDGTEVWAKFGPPNAYTITPTIATTPATNGIVYAAMTNVTAAATAGVLGQVVYASAGIVRYTFTPNAEEGLYTNQVGKVRLYFKAFVPGSF